MTQHDDDQAAGPPPATGILVTIDEAHAAAERLGDDTTVAELLRSIILAGRDVRVMIEPPMPATLEQIAAGLDEAGRLMQVRAVLARWRPIRDLVTIPGHYIAELFDGVAEAVGDPPAPRQYEAITQHDLMLEIIKAAGAAGALPGQIMAEMVRTGRAWGRRSELYPALDKAQKDGLVVQPLTRGRYYWHECAPAGDAIAEAIAGIPRPGSAEQSPGGSLDVAIAEATAMEERDRAAGGPPWMVSEHPDHGLPGGWHLGQLGGQS